MRTAYEVGKIRTAELELMDRLPVGTLMQRAAAGLAATCSRMLGTVYGSRVVLLVGSGDNGGDALFAGARLARRGARVEAILAGSKTHETGLAALKGAGGRVTEELGDPDLIIDGLVGIGASGALRRPYADLATEASRSVAPVIAVDVPSGVDAGTGRIDGEAITADVSVTFGAHKPGLLIDPGAGHAGFVELVDIGLGPHLPDPDVAALQAEDIDDLLPRPGQESDKYRRGVVGVEAGSERFTGAAVLAVGGAVRGGAGMVRFAGGEPDGRGAGPDRVAELIRARWAEAVIGDGRVQAWVAGPGMGTGDEALARLRKVLGSDVPVLLDADALTLVANDRDLLRRPAPTLLTPHAGELARLLGVPREQIEARRLEHVRRAAAELSVTVLLKGSTTLVAEVDRPVRVNPTGTPRLATGGTGDVLSGLIGALLAGGMSPYDAASCGAYLHGLAARKASHGDGAGDGEAPIAAMDVAEALPEAYRSLSP